jgi:hypothetical protein
LIIPGKESNFISPFGSRFKRFGQSHEEAGLSLVEKGKYTHKRATHEKQQQQKKIILNYLNLPKAHTKIVSREQANE